MKSRTIDIYLIMQNSSWYFDRMR